MRKLISIMLALVLAFALAACQKAPDNSASYQLSAPAKGDTVAVMHTNFGDIKIKLFPKEAPKAVENFTTHAKNGYYDGVTFHRVIQDFMIQGGDPEGTGRGGESIWGEAFEDEFSNKLHNYRGALSMANAGTNTNGSQFFIVQASSVNETVLSQYGSALGFDSETIENYKKNGGTPHLDQKHTVFGQVYEGMDVVDKIAAVKTNSNDHPMEDVLIHSIEVQEITE